MSSQKVEVVITGQNAGLLNALQGAGAATENMAHQMESAVGGIAATFEKFMAPMAAFLGVLGGGALFKEAVTETAQFGDELAKSSQKVGVSVESLSGLAHAATLSGVAFEDLTGGLAKLAKNMQLAVFTPSSPTAAAFKALGIQVTDAQGHLRGTEDVLDDVAEKFSHMEDGAGKTALAMNLFGRSGKELIPFLNEGREGLAEMKAEAERLGISMSTEQAKAAEKYKDDMERVDETLKGLKIRVANEVLPALDRMAEWFSDQAPAMLQGISTAFGGIGAVLGNSIVQVVALSAAITFAIQSVIVPMVMSAVTALQKLGWQFVIARMNGATLGSSLASMVNPVFLVTAAVVGLAFGYEHLVTAESRAAEEHLKEVQKMGQLQSQSQQLTSRLAELDAIQKSAKSSEDAKKAAEEEEKTIIEQLVSIYPNFMKFLYDEQGRRREISEAIKLENADRLENAKRTVEEAQAHLANAQALLAERKERAESARYAPGGPGGAGIAKSANQGYLNSAIADSEKAIQIENQALQQALQNLQKLQQANTDHKTAAPDLEHPGKAAHAAKAKAAHDAAEVEFDRHLKAEQAAQVAHNNDMAAISMGALELEERKINLSFTKKLETAREAGASEADLAALENARLDALDKARSNAAQKQAEARKKIAEQEAKEARQFLEQYGSAQQGFLDGIEQATKRAGSIFQQFARASEQMLHGIQTAFSTGIQGILTGTMSLSQGVKTMASGVLQSVAGMVSQLIAHWLLYEVILKALGLSEGTENAGRASGALVTASAETWAAYAGIPFVGPALAVAQIEAMYASMSASTAQAATAGAAVIPGAAEGGWFDRPTFAMVGEGKRPELVVPDVAFKDFAANLSTNILAQERAAQGYGLQANGYARAAAGRAGAGGETVMHVHLPNAVLLDGSQRGLRGLGALVIDGARSKAREIGVVLTPGQVFGGM